MSKEEERDYYVDACAERRAAARRVLRSTPRRSSDVLTGMGLAEILAVYLEWEDLMALRALGLGAWRELSMEWMLKERRAPARIAVHAMRRLLKAVRRTAALVHWWPTTWRSRTRRRTTSSAGASARCAFTCQGSNLLATTGISSRRSSSR